MDDYPSIFADIVRDCLQFEPASRPTANDIAERLVRWQFRGTDLDRDENGNTNIHRLLVSSSDSHESFKELNHMFYAKKPLMINAVNNLGETPLMLATESNLLHEFLKYRRVPLSNDEPSRVMEYYHNIDIFGTLLKLAEKEDVDAIKLLGENYGFDRAIVKEVCVQRNHANGETALHIAAKIGNVALFDALLDLGVFEAWRANTDGRTALHLASLYGHAEIMQKLISLQDSSGKKEDAHSCRVNIQDERGKTPLHLAAASGNLSAARTLLDHSTTSINLRDVDERSAIFDLVSETSIDASAQAKAFQAFVQHRSIDLSMKDSRGETVFHQLARGDLVQSAQILVERDDVRLSDRESERWYTPVHLAVREQSFRVARMWLARDDVDVNLIDKHGNTLVHILASLRISVDGNHMIFMSFAKTLISRDDINLSLRNARGDTALHVAVQSKNTIVAEVLLSEKNNKVTGNDFTALHLQPDSSMAKVMKSVDINARDIKNKTPLHLASYVNAAEIAKLLLSRGDVDINARDKDQQTPLHSASERNAHKVAKLLLSRDDVDINARDEDQQTPLHSASEWNAHIVAKLLLSRDDVDVKARDRLQETPLHRASQKNATEVAKLLLTRGDVNVSALNSLQRTPLHLASYGNASEVAKLLLTRGDVDVTAQDQAQYTPLHLASLENAADVAKLLLSRGDVDVNARNKRLETPLHVASHWNAAEVAKLLLLRHDVDVNARDEWQRTPLHLASNENAAEVAKLLLSRDEVDVNARNKRLETPLHRASWNKAAEVAKLLLSRDEVDVNARNKWQETPLHRASWNKAAEVAKLLISRGDVDVNARDKNHQTPLHTASLERAHDITKLLLSRDDVNANARNDSGETALDIVELMSMFGFSERMKECAELLRAGGTTSTPMPMPEE